MIDRYAAIRPGDTAVDDEFVGVTLKDGRIIGTPIVWYPWLADATPEQQSCVELLPDGIYWTNLDEGLEIEGMLRGIRPACAPVNVSR